MHAPTLCLVVLLCVWAGSPATGQAPEVVLLPENATAPVNNTAAAGGFLGSLPELQVCYHVGWGSAWVLLVPVRIGRSLLSWPFSIVWGYIVRPILTPFIWILTTWVVSFIPLFIWRYLLVAPVAFLWHYLALVLSALCSVLWVCLTWLPSLLPPAAIVALLVAHWHTHERLEAKERRWLLIATGVVTLLWASYLCSTLSTMVAVVGVPLAIYSYTALQRFDTLTKRKRMGIAAGIGTGAVFCNALVWLLTAVLCCPFAFVAGYSHLLPDWVTTLVGHGFAGGLISLLVTLVTFLLLALIRYVVLPNIMLELWLAFCRRRKILKPPAVTYYPLTPEMPQYSIAMLALKNCVPFERLERVMLVGAPHRQGRYLQLKDSEFLACLVARKEDMDCHLRLTGSWCSSNKCLICHTCHAGLMRRVPLSWWVKLPRLTPALYTRDDMEYLLVGRAKQSPSKPPWWTRWDPEDLDSVWVERYRWLPVYLVCLTPMR